MLSTSVGLGLLEVPGAQVWWVDDTRVRRLRVVVGEVTETVVAPHIRHTPVPAPQHTDVHRRDRETEGPTV